MNKINTSIRKAQLFFESAKTATAGTLFLSEFSKSYGPTIFPYYFNATGTRTDVRKQIACRLCYVFWQQTRYITECDCLFSRPPTITS